MKNRQEKNNVSNLEKKVNRAKFFLVVLSSISAFPSFFCYFSLVPLPMDIMDSMDINFFQFVCLFTASDLAHVFIPVMLIYFGDSLQQRKYLIIF